MPPIRRHHCYNVQAGGLIQATRAPLEATIEATRAPIQAKGLTDSTRLQCKRARGKRRGISPGAAARHSHSARVIRICAKFLFFSPKFQVEPAKYGVLGQAQSETLNRARRNMQHDVWTLHDEVWSLHNEIWSMQNEMRYEACKTRWDTPMKHARQDQISPLQHAIWPATWDCKSPSVSLLYTQAQSSLLYSQGTVLHQHHVLRAARVERGHARERDWHRQEETSGERPGVRARWVKGALPLCRTNPGIVAGPCSWHRYMKSVTNGWDVLQIDESWPIWTIHEQFMNNSWTNASCHT